MGITLGTASSPSQITKNFDALISTSLENYREGLIDNISASNAFLSELRKSDAWQGEDGGLIIAQDLMYGFAPFSAYDGFDELSDDTTDGITQAQFEWRQGGVPITYSMKEIKQNKHRIVNLAESKIKQAEMGWVEAFNKALLQGSLSQAGGTTLHAPYVESSNGANFIDPLPLLVKYDPTTSTVIGNINQSTHSWWRNQTTTSAATTYDGLLLEFDEMYDLCSRGPGGEPNLIIMDERSKRLLNFAYYQRYRENLKRDGNYPFDNLMFRNARIVWDQYVPDVETGVAATTTYGSAFFLNTKYFKVIYEEDTLFTRTDFQKPPKGDSRLAHILFMGQTIVTNRRKQGVIGKIATSLT
jgi:hypothetical protein